VSHRVTPKPSDAGKRRHSGRDWQRCPHIGTIAIEDEQKQLEIGGFKLQCVKCGRFLHGETDLATLKPSWPRTGNPQKMARDEGYEDGWNDATKAHRGE